MASKKKKDQFSPPFMHPFRAAFEAKDARKKLDLRDESGERVIAARRSPARRAVTDSMLRKELATDLDNLLNTINLAAADDIDDFAHVKRSILNYGIPDTTKYSVGEIAVGDIAKKIEQALKCYEPRLIEDSIKIERDDMDGDRDINVRFIVRADMFCNPVNIPVEFVADLEFDSGKIQINRL